AATAATRRRGRLPEPPPQPLALGCLADRAQGRAPQSRGCVDIQPSPACRLTRASRSSSTSEVARAGRPLCPPRGGHATMGARGAGRGDDTMERGEAVIQRRAERCEYLQFERLAAVPGLVHAVFTRRGGYSSPPYQGLNLGGVVGDDRAMVRRNRE